MNNVILLTQINECMIFKRILKKAKRIGSIEVIDVRGGGGVQGNFVLVGLI